MTAPATPTTYFTFTADWLDERYRQSEDAKRERRRHAVMDVPKQLANQTHNRIRAAKADWQPLRWRIRHKITDAVKGLTPGFHAGGVHKFVEHAYPNHRLTLAHTLGDRLRLRATLAFLNDRVDHKLSPRCYGSRHDARGRLVCEAHVPKANLAAPEFQFYLRAIAIESDRFEYALTGQDIE